MCEQEKQLRSGGFLAQAAHSTLIFVVLKLHFQTAASDYLTNDSCMYFFIVLLDTTILSWPCVSGL
jgi:hypothetical protein